MEAIDTELSNIHEQLQQLDKDIGFHPDRRLVRRGAPIVYRGNGVDRRSDGSENYGYRNENYSHSRENLKRRREPEDDEEEDIERRPKRILPSTVILPNIETQSRDAKLQEMAKTENKDVVKRNRRMFSNLMGTLTQFKKEAKPKTLENMQKEKLLEVEKKLEEQKEKDKQQLEDDRMSKIEKRKELEAAQKALTRKKALMQYADAKKKHYQLMSNYIMTNTKPALFFLPAKHNLRSMELLRASEKKMQGLIARRDEELERELEAPMRHAQEEDDETLKSIVSKPGSRRDRDRKERNGDDKTKQSTPKPEEESEGEDDEGHEPDVPPEHRIVIE